MVNIDAKVEDSNGDICRVEIVYDDEILVSYGGSHAEDSDFLKHGTYTVIEDIRGELKQQKQRADELENQWNNLRDRLVEIYKNDTETGKQYLRSFICLLDELEGKENVFETVQNLKD